MNMIQDSYVFNKNTTLRAVYEEISDGAEVPVPDGATTTAGKRKLFRHPNNQGTVVVYDYWGAQKQLFVPDAKYRHTSKAYDSTNRDHGLHKANVTTGYFSDLAKQAPHTLDLNKDTPQPYSDNDTSPLPYSRDDAWIQKNYADLKNDGTAKYNTDKLMTFGTTDAAHHCRAQNISSIGQCDLPNLYQLIILYLESDNIDNLDPTVNSNRDKALGMKNTYGRFDFNNSGRVWSSTERDSTYAWSVYYYGGAGCYYIQGNTPGVVPVKELG